MLLAGALGAIAAIYDFYTVSSGIDGTGGVELVIASGSNFRQRARYSHGAVKTRSI
jgi:hypothetical protein